MRSSLITATAGAYALLGGALSFLGWVTGAVRLRDWFDVGIGIKTNTALALCIAGAGLLLTLPAARMPAARYAVRALGVLVAAIGGLTLLQHLVHVDLGIDTLIFTEPPGAPATTSPNRMGLPASACLLAFGVGLWLQTGAVMARRAAVILGLAVLAISSLSLVGYWFGAQDMYSAARVTAISLQTATMLAALAIGLIAACPDRHPMRTLAGDGPSSVLARRLLPFVLLVPLGTGWIGNKGQQLGYYDAAFGSALRSLLQVFVLGALVWWSLRMFRRREIEQQRAEAQRRLAEEALREADGRKDRFIATLAHELRNPLAPIQNSAKIVMLKSPKEPQLLWAVEVIDRQVRHMAHLLDDLLDVSRISRDRLELRPKDALLEDIVRNAVETSRPLIDAAHHRLEVELPDAPVALHVDAVRIAQVLTNVLNNAARYTPSGGLIRVIATVDARNVVVRVLDNGVGLSAALLPQIFEMFSQGDSAITREKGGLGIGLALSRGLVELHGGHMEARSDGAGRGAEFIFTLPRPQEATKQR